MLLAALSAWTAIDFAGDFSLQKAGRRSVVLRTTWQVDRSHLVGGMLDAGHFLSRFPLFRGCGPPYRKSEDDDELEEESDVDS